MYTTTLDTPDGPFSIVVAAVPGDGEHPAGEAVLAAGWTRTIDALLLLIHPTLRPTTDPGPAEHEVEAGTEQDTGIDLMLSGSGVLGEAVDAVRAYYDGDLGAPGRVPVRQASGPFRTHAWDVLRDVKAGERLTYSEYAVRAGRPAAVRAAAGACAMNAAALFVPCHRILRTDGTLGGFRYGLPIKESLLAREI
jgi:methylated-DNA-[protein]-cysteine S-methyltransferase